jgi:hypothetical protein
MSDERVDRLKLIDGPRSVAAGVEHEVAYQPFTSVAQSGVS